MLQFSGSSYMIQNPFVLYIKIFHALFRKKRFFCFKLLWVTVPYMRVKAEARRRAMCIQRSNLSQRKQLQPLIALCNVLPRVRSQDIHCLRSKFFNYVLMFVCYGYIHLKKYVCYLNLRN